MAELLIVNIYVIIFVEEKHIHDAGNRGFKLNTPCWPTCFVVDLCRALA